MIVFCCPPPPRRRESGEVVRHPAHQFLVGRVSPLLSQLIYSHASNYQLREPLQVGVSRKEGLQVSLFGRVVRTPAYNAMMASVGSSFSQSQSFVAGSVTSGRFQAPGSRPLGLI